ncbi:WbqC-like protein family protein [Prevotella aff. ruminicola Tc2-24]|uniref:WbqC-like protein family protein n=1 Tax=Prevotella aff. ruminicola Tc2-24 TaxID=81582 RepID=A0A1I0N8X1_9BACT|nr:WbqC family protein [Prevotella aff. ruminicola Tc2-24]SEV97298.1 WbqC-like protein family protein [Prevotella aff. ruminicola Tc2-24]
MESNSRQPLSTTYFGPVQWYQRLCQPEQVWIERWESFQKQTLRNRCLIASANGVQALTVPVEHSAGNCLVKDVRISDHGNWRHLHWNALRSAYGKSPFFDYYEDDLHPFFENIHPNRWAYLFDFNEAIREKMCELIDIHPVVSYTTTFVQGGLTDAEALPVGEMTASFKPYYQVWQEKHGFLPNLSILDLLFNMGPESIFYL